jgi:hypothetical protein
LTESTDKQTKERGRCMVYYYHFSIIQFFMQLAFKQYWLKNWGDFVSPLKTCYANAQTS